MPTLRLPAAVACALVLVGLAVTPTTQGAVQGPASTDASRFIGSWALAAYESNDADTQTLRGARPIGVIFYDGTGHMAVQIAPDRARRRFTGPVSELFSGPRPTPDEAFDAIAGYAAYFGTYIVDDRAKTVTHKRAANLNPGGLGDFVRRYEFPTPDRLVLVPLERADRRSIRLTWERQR